MGIVSSLKTRAAELGGRAVEQLFADEKRAEKIGELFMLVQRGRRAVDASQEKLLRGVGMASSGEVKATGKRVAKLRRAARALDEKLGRLTDQVGKEAAGQVGPEAAGTEKTGV